jgi:hypothetical protein
VKPKLEKLSPKPVGPPAADPPEERSPMQRLLDRFR